MDPNNYSLLKKGIILISVPLFVGTLFVIGLYVLFSRAETEAEDERRGKQVVSETELLAKHCVDAEGALVNYYLSGKGSDSEKWKKRYEHLVPMLAEGVDEVDSLLQNDKKQRENVEQLKKGIAAGTEVLKQIRTEIDSGASQEKLQSLRLSVEAIFEKEIITPIVNIVKIQRDENKRHVPSRRWRDSVMPFLVGGMVLNAAVTVALSIFFSHSIVSRLRVLMDNTEKLARSEPLNPAVTGRDEIAHLDRVFNDMSKALAEARRKERAITDNALDVICSIDGAGNFTAVNPASLTAWGFEPSFLLNKPLLAFIHPDDREPTSRRLQEVMQGKGKAQLESRVMHRNGSVVHVLWSVNWSAEEASLFCVAHDVSERHELERLKQEFVAMVSHDLRTPLTSIQGFLELLSDGIYGDLNTTGLKRAGIANRDAGRLISLINDILDMEKLSSGSFALAVRHVQLAAIIEHSIEAVRGFAEKNHVRLHCEPVDQLVAVDPDRIIQVLVNLLSNAVKFSPGNSSVTVNVTCEPPWAVVKIIDKGRGIPTEYLGSIFERFKQVQTTDATEKKGSGLGLAISKAIVEQHGGTIGVESTVGKGSAFWFRIPLAHTVSGV